MVDRLTDEAQATGAVDTITREGPRLIGHNTDVLGFRAALDALVGKQKMPKNAVIIGAGGGARAAVYTLITGGFQRVIVFNRHLHRGEGLIRHFGRSASHMELRAMPWHESVIESELAKTKVLINASAVSDAATSPIPAELLAPDLLVLDLMFWPAETKLMRDARRRRGRSKTATRCCSTRRRPRSDSGRGWTSPRHTPEPTRCGARGATGSRRNNRGVTGNLRAASFSASSIGR